MPEIKWTSKDGESEYTIGQPFTVAYRMYTTTETARVIVTPVRSQVTSYPSRTVSFEEYYSVDITFSTGVTTKYGHYGKMPPSIRDISESITSYLMR